jgi:hypothetical protein
VIFSRRTAGGHVECIRKKKNAHKAPGVGANERNSLEDFCVGGRIILCRYKTNTIEGCGVESSGSGLEILAGFY